MFEQYSRQIVFDSILNFRDLGGYRTHSGRKTAWRRIFRSGELHRMTERDVRRLKEEIRLSTVIDLRSPPLAEQLGIGPITEVGVKFYSVPLSIITDDDNWTIQEIYRDFTNSGEVYLYRIRNKEYGKRLVEALEIIAKPENYPLVFHCYAGKDRSGILAAILLNVLGILDEDIINDYTLSAPYMDEFIKRWDDDPITADINKNLPPYQLEAAPESMAFFLSMLKREYGSAKEYIENHGADRSLWNRLERALLV